MNKEETLSRIYEIETEQELVLRNIDAIYENIPDIAVEGIEQNPALAEETAKIKMLIMERVGLYESIGMQPRWGLPKRLMSLSEDELDLDEFFQQSDMTRSVKPWDFLDPNTQYADEQLANERYNICKNCPMFIKLSKQCKKCGCFMKAKTKLLDASCPIGEW